MSRTYPSTTKPAILRCRALVLTKSPSTAFIADPPASTTRMSFGAARSRALCTIRLSPGNTLTVQAGPRIRRWGAVTFRIAVHIVYRRFIRSEIMGVSNSRNPATNAGSGRPIWRRIRNPGPGFNSDVIGLLTMAPTSRRPPPRRCASSVGTTCHVDIRWLPRAVGPAGRNGSQGWQGRCQRAERRTARARWHRPDPQDDTHARAQVIDNEPNHPLSLPMESVALAQHQDVRPGQMGSDFCRTSLARARGCP